MSPHLIHVISSDILRSSTMYVLATELPVFYISLLFFFFTYILLYMQFSLSRKSFPLYQFICSVNFSLCFRLFSDVVFFAIASFFVKETRSLCFYWLCILYLGLLVISNHSICVFMSHIMYSYRSIRLSISRTLLNSLLWVWYLLCGRVLKQTNVNLKDWFV